MNHSITFTIIKPDAMLAKHQGLILNDIIKADFAIKAMRQIHMSKMMAEQFYQVHADKPFYDELTTFMSSSPVVVAVLQKANAVVDFRKLIGATNPADAAEGTIRKKFAKSLGENAVHGSDSEENAWIEASFFFPTSAFSP